ncbi:hypothetical protein SXCC_03027 [Gluconacetobacter sp. SXCC-1]|nr:hypothetical protein SXCC_03027 [Gluconacetobacter sp. SXCC-1]
MGGPRTAPRRGPGLHGQSGQDQSPHAQGDQATERGQSIPEACVFHHDPLLWREGGIFAP